MTLRRRGTAVLLILVVGVGLATVSFAFCVIVVSIIGRNRQQDLRFLSSSSSRTSLSFFLALLKKSMVTIGSRD